MTLAVAPASSVALSRGDVEALYRRHAHLVLRRARSLLGAEHDAEEVLQDVFMRLVEKPASFQGRAAVTTYLYAATTNACLNRLRNMKRRARLVTLFVRSPTPPAAVAEALVLFRETLARVPRELAEVAVYAHVDEMTHDEIAEIVGCARRTVGDRLARFEDAARRVQGDSP